MSDIARRPSPALRAWLESEIDSWVDDGSLGNWPRRVGREARALVVDGNNVDIWYLGLDGTLFVLGTDDICQRLEPVTDREQYLQVLRRAAAHHPQLAELLDEHPTAARP